MSWWKSSLPKRASDAQMNSELRFHIDELTDEYIAAGMPPQEARRRASWNLAASEKFKEEVRDVYRIRVLDATFANLKSAFRFIRKSPTFSVTVILTLALAIGANSAVFSAIDAILLQPLPFPDADALMRVDQYNPKTPSPFHLVAPVRLEDWNRLNSTFQALTGYYTEDVSESTGPLPEKVTRAWVSPRFFQVWASPRARPGIYPRRADPQRSGCRPDQRPLLAPPFQRRSQHHREKSAPRWPAGSYRRRNATLVPLSSSRRRFMVPDSCWFLLRPGPRRTIGSPSSGALSPA